MGKGSFGCLAAIGVAFIVVLIMAVIGQEMNNREAEEIAIGNLTIHELINLLRGVPGKPESDFFNFFSGTSFTLRFCYQKAIYFGKGHGKYLFILHNSLSSLLVFFVFLRSVIHVLMSQDILQNQHGILF